MPKLIPRKIDPSLIELGDTISVVHKRNQGIVTILEGVVHERKDSGNVRYFVTKEGATLLAWIPGRHDVKVTLLSRPEFKQQTLFEFDNGFLDGVKERIA